MHFLKLQCTEWLADDALGDCSLESQGFWVRILCFMNNSAVRGLLLKTNGEPFDVSSLSRKMGYSHHKVKKLLSELEAQKVFSRVDEKLLNDYSIAYPEGYPHNNSNSYPHSYLGVIYSRRMVRETKEHQKFSAYGRKGAEVTNQKGRGPEYRVKNLDSKKPNLKVRQKSSDKSEAFQAQKQNPQTENHQADDRCSEIREEQFQRSQRTVFDELGTSSSLEPASPPVAKTSPPKRRTPPKRASQMPQDFQLTPKMRDYAEGKGLDAEREFEHFSNHHLAKGSTFKDWGKAWCTWCCNGSRFKTNRPQQRESSSNRVARWQREMNERYAEDDTGFSKLIRQPDPTRRIALGGINVH